MTTIDTKWKAGISLVKELDSTKISKWFEQSSDNTKYPGLFADLFENAKKNFNLINQILIECNKDNFEECRVTISLILEKLKEFFNKLSKKEKSYETVLLDLILQTHRLVGEYKQNVPSLVFIPDLSREQFKTYFPSSVAHFSLDKLYDIFNINEFFLTRENYDPINFICRLKLILNESNIQALDKEFQSLDDSKSISSRFNYQCLLEFHYLDLLKHMIEEGVKNIELIELLDDITTNWFNVYPFRLLNKDGVFIPENFFICFCNYIKKTYGNHDDDTIKNVYRINRIYYALSFLTKFKATRTPPMGHFNTVNEFLDKYDSKKPYATSILDNYYVQLGLQSVLEDPDEDEDYKAYLKTLMETKLNLRSIYFREDFDYYNSLNIRGTNLNRNFWQTLDAVLEPVNESLGQYLDLIQTVDNISEFYQNVAPKLGTTGNNVVTALDKEVERYKNICGLDRDKPDVPLGKEFDKEIAYFTEQEYVDLAKTAIFFIRRTDDYFEYDSAARKTKFKFMEYISSIKKDLLESDSLTVKSVPLLLGPGGQYSRWSQQFAINAFNSPVNVKYPLIIDAYSKDSYNKGKLRAKVVNGLIKICFVEFNMSHVLDTDVTKPSLTTTVRTKLQFDVLQNYDAVAFIDRLIDSDDLSFFSIYYFETPEKIKLPDPILRDDDSILRLNMLTLQFNELIDVTKPRFENMLEIDKATNEMKKYLLDALYESIRVSDSRIERVDSINKVRIIGLEREKLAEDETKKIKAREDAIIRMETLIQKHIDAFNLRRATIESIKTVQSVTTKKLTENRTAIEDIKIRIIGLQQQIALKRASLDTSGIPALESEISKLEIDMKGYDIPQDVILEALKIISKDIYKYAKVEEETLLLNVQAEKYGFSIVDINNDTKLSDPDKAAKIAEKQKEIDDTELKIEGKLKEVSEIAQDSVLIVDDSGDIIIMSRYKEEITKYETYIKALTPEYNIYVALVNKGSAHYTQIDAMNQKKTQLDAYEKELTKFKELNGIVTMFKATFDAKKKTYFADIAEEKAKKALRDKEFALSLVNLKDGQVVQIADEAYAAEERKLLREVKAFLEDKPGTKDSGEARTMDELKDEIYRKNRGRRLRAFEKFHSLNMELDVLKELPVRDLEKERLKNKEIDDAKAWLKRVCKFQATLKKIVPP